MPAKKAEIEKFAAENDRYYPEPPGGGADFRGLDALCLLLVGRGERPGALVRREAGHPGGLSLGTLVGFTGYIAMLTRPIRQTGRIVDLVIRAVTSAERIFAILDTEPEIKDAPGAYELPEVTGRVEYADVEFSYDGQTPILKGVSFTAEPEEVVAIVGPTGAGKSTILHLLPRFYEPTAGKITIDGHEIDKVTVKSLRSKIGLILQDPFLFAATIAENIAFGKPGATMEEIRWAAKIAQIDDFIGVAARRLRHLVGSGGPALRRAEAAAGHCPGAAGPANKKLNPDPAPWMNPPPAWTRNRGPPQESPGRGGKGADRDCRRPPLVEPYRNADKILVLQDGRVVESGTHEELLARGGFMPGLTGRSCRQPEVPGRGMVMRGGFRAQDHRGWGAVQTLPAGPEDLGPGTGVHPLHLGRLVLASFGAMLLVTGPRWRSRI